MSHHLRATLFVAASLVASSILSSCASPGAESQAQVAGTSWTARSIGAEAAPTEGAPTLTFGEEYRVSGNTGCNNFYGVYSVDGESVAFQGLGAQERACDPAIMAREAAFMEILRTAQDVRVDEVGRLVISASDGRRVVMAQSAM